MLSWTPAASPPPPHAPSPRVMLETLQPKTSKDDRITKGNSEEAVQCKIFIPAREFSQKGSVSDFRRWEDGGGG